jgi:hypothetical protein
MLPAVCQKLDVHLSEEVAKAMVFALLRSICYSPQGGWLAVSRSCMSGASFLYGLRTSVGSFAM